MVHVNRNETDRTGPSERNQIMSNVSATVTAAVAVASASDSHVRQTLMGSAVVSISNALRAGITSESAIVDGVQALAFMALDRIGTEMLADGYDVKTSKAFSNPYTMILNYLVNDSQIVFRGTEALFAEHVKGKKGAERVKGVQNYMKAAKGKDLVWTVAQIRALAKKVIAATVETETGKEFCRSLSLCDTAEARKSKFMDHYLENYGETYKDLTTAFTVPSSARDDAKAETAMIAAIGKIMDVDRLNRLLNAVIAQTEVASRQKENAAEMLLPVNEDEGRNDDNVVVLRAA